MSTALLGTPLATPGRRLAAILLDLVIIGLVTVVTKSFGILLGVVAALYFVRAGFKRIPVEGSVFGRAMRFSVGCLGLFIGFVTFVVWASVSMNVALDPADDRADDVIERALASSPAGPAQASPAPAGADSLEPDSLEPDSLEPDSAATATASPDTMPAGDSIARLLARIDALDGVVSATRADLAATERALEDATEGGLVAWLRNVADDLGFGFGWATLYMTAILPWWNGRTVGKRLVGIRVVRLDGEPITWWTAFERAGGYAAGFATGLLGFAQVYWDANRQGIHDRIVGTVVVRDGVDKVIDWESAL